ncbi:MAG: DUF3667 domain-containing protein [Bacteroidota bacterium]
MKKKATHECKNCSAESEGQYCSFCGQRYHAHKESFGELVYEFVSDFLHFDSRFFKTLLPLLFLPGKLTKSYNDGRQRSQFHPIRLYLFSSFVYFFLFFYFNNVEEQFEVADKQNPASFIIDSVRSVIQKDSLKLLADEAHSKAIQNAVLTENLAAKAKSDKKEFITLKDSTLDYSFTVSSSVDSLLKKNTTPDEYKEMQNKLPDNRKDGFVERAITMRLLKINLEGEAGRKEFIKKLLATFFHNIPKMLFFLLPVFALLLKLLYVRRKQFYFVDHTVLSLHYFSFIFLMLIFSVYILDAVLGTDIFTKLAIAWILIYLPVAMKKLYGQSWRKTLVKVFLLGFLFTSALIAALVLNIAWSAFIV